MSTTSKRVKVTIYRLVFREKQKILPHFIWVLYIFFGDLIIFSFFICPVNTAMLFS